MREIAFSKLQILEVVYGSLYHELCFPRNNYFRKQMTYCRRARTSMFTVAYHVITLAQKKTKKAQRCSDDWLQQCPIGILSLFSQARCSTEKFARLKAHPRGLDYKDRRRRYNTVYSPIIAFSLMTA